MRALAMAIMMECVYQQQKERGQTRQEVASGPWWAYYCWKNSLLALKYFQR